MLAASRTPSDMARVMYLVVSIITKNGANGRGAFCGVSILKNFLLCWIMDLAVVLIIMVNESLNVIIMWEVVVNTYGSNPIRLIVVNIVNILINRGLYCCAFFLMCSLVKLLVIVNSVCVIMEFRLGSIFVLLFIVIIRRNIIVSVSVRFLILTIVSLDFM